MRAVAVNHLCSSVDETTARTHRHPVCGELEDSKLAGCISLQQVADVVLVWSEGEVHGRLSTNMAPDRGCCHRK